ncbi:FecR family protein [Tistlia consotensis]|uniref:FecR family protein n=1 Tax=Tistlia consotensis USBA 355 TaxID=560819 RepID=A0A1Y6C3D1_9PROT|nr:FecR domain-containing protein [Tistlia consotensis]SMF43558.1 FecR family protein [Tistlia consotensis USBA 355]SNR42691.1 FecR family protein [Tistlia consotensis]
MTDQHPARREAPGEAAHRWIVRLASGDVAADELDALERWLAAAPGHRHAFEQARATWRAAGALEEAFAAPGRPAAPAKAPRRAHGLSARPLALAAALLAAAVVLAVLLPGQRADISTAAGEQRVVTLADGSSVTLNTDSALALRYTPEQRRVVLLHGEAFFRVAHDSARPFVVSALGGTAEAVGTAFAVRQEAERVSVAVVEGRVRVASPEAGDATLLLAPGDSASYRPDRPPRAGRHRPPEQVAAWRDGRIVLDGLPFRAAVAELARYFPGRVLVAGAPAVPRAVSGVFSPRSIGRAIAAVGETQGLSSLQLGDYLLVLH